MEGLSPPSDQLRLLLPLYCVNVKWEACINYYSIKPGNLFSLSIPICCRLGNIGVLEEDGKIFRLDICQQSRKIGLNWQCVELGYTSAMYSDRLYFGNVLRYGKFQHCIKVEYSSAFYLVGTDIHWDCEYSDNDLR